MNSTPSQNFKIVVACDHAGIEMKNRVSSHLRARGFEVADIGTHTPERVDYPDMVEKAADYFRQHRMDFIILICGTGIGMSIAANKKRGIFCALADNTYSAEMARRHNHANCLALPARVNTQEPMEAILDSFFDVSPEGGRHQERVDKIKSWEE